MKKKLLKRMMFLIAFVGCSFVVKAGNIYVAKTGNDANDGSSLGLAKLTIQAAINGSANNDVILIGAGTYNELVTIDKSLTIDGVDAASRTITYGLAVGGGITPALFKVTAQNVIIKNLGFDVDLTKTPSAIITSGNTDGLQVLNNRITATVAGTTGYGLRNAISVNVDLGIAGVTTVPDGFGNLVFKGNTIAGTTAINAAFRSGIAVDACGFTAGGTLVGEGNTITSINNDITGRFNSVGPINVIGNSFFGGGIELLEYNAGSGDITVESNTFNYSVNEAPEFALLRLKNNAANKLTTVKNNTFTNHNWFVSLENYQNVVLDGNTFTPTIKDVATKNFFRLVTVNSKTITSSQIAQRSTLSATFINNTFNGAVGAVGKAIAFYNHDALAAAGNPTPAVFGTFVVGNPTNKNTFNDNISTYIYFDNTANNITRVGSVYMVGFPEYGENIFPTNTGYWTANVAADQNNFFVDGQLRGTAGLTTPQKVELNAKIVDKNDDSNLGEVILNLEILPVSLVNFEAKATTIGALISWTTASETSNAKFIIEKSLDGKAFANLKEIAAKGAGKYEFTDKTFSASAYYKLVQVDVDGKATAYDDFIRFVDGFNTGINLVAYPNPTISSLFVDVKTAKAETIQMKLIDISGKTVLSLTKKSNEIAEVDMSTQKPGVYTLQIATSGGVKNQKVIKQ